MCTQHIYGKFVRGDSLKDSELLSGIEAFKAAADALFKLGPAFSIPAKEANSVYFRFRDFAAARGIIKEG